MKKIISILFAVIAPPVFAGVGPPEPVIVAIPKSAFQKAKPMPTETEEDEVDPAKLAERIAANGKNATDRLAMNDPGRETQNVQERILKDLDKLLNQPPPPPMGGEGEGGMPPPMGGEPPPMGGQKPMGNQQPMPMGQSGKPMPMGGQPMPMGGQPMPMGQGQQQQPAGGNQPGVAGVTTPMPPPALALEDRVTKDVWGHLPPQLRQKMNQYYQEQFMPRYAELLKQYYVELAEREKEKKK